MFVVRTSARFFASQTLATAILSMSCRSRTRARVFVFKIQKLNTTPYTICSTALQTHSDNPARALTCRVSEKLVSRVGELPAYSSSRGISSELLGEADKLAPKEIDAGAPPARTTRRSREQGGAEQAARTRLATSPIVITPIVRRRHRRRRRWNATTSAIS